MTVRQANLSGAASGDLAVLMQLMEDADLKHRGKRIAGGQDSGQAGHRRRIAASLTAGRKANAIADAVQLLGVVSDHSLGQA